MKIQRFLVWIQEHLLNYPDISLKTVKMFLDNFTGCLSAKEIERNRNNLQIISELTLKQISLDIIVNNHKYKNLENQLNNLKDDTIE